MAHARTALGEANPRSSPSLLRLTLVALVLALAFDALSTALAWNLVRALPGTAKHSPVRAVRQTDVRDPSRPLTPDGDAAAQ
jgi:hypothetical protein